MNTPSRIIISLALMCALSCTHAPTQDPDPDWIAHIAPNGMMPSAIQDHLAAAARMANAPLSAAGASELLATTDGLTVLRYLVMCALPGGESLRVPGALLLGDMGLAASWATRPLDADGRRWVSACLLAKANQLGAVVLVSNLGPHPELSTTAQELLDYPIEEGAFYGDLFADVPTAFACRGVGPGDAGGMTMRRCAVADPERSGLTLCGFTAAGTCADACQVGDGFHVGCGDSAGRTDQVITTHVTP